MIMRVFMTLIIIAAFADAGWAVEFSAEQKTRIGKRAKTGKIYFQPIAGGSKWRARKGRRYR